MTVTGRDPSLDFHESDVCTKISMGASVDIATAESGKEDP